MRVPASLVALLALLPAAAAEEAGGLSARLSVPSSSVTLAVPFEATIEVALPPGFRVAGEAVGPILDDVSVLDGGWEATPSGEGPSTRRWRGRLAAFRLGEVTIPPVRVGVLAPDGGAAAVETEAVPLTVAGAIEASPEAAQAPEIADLKPAAVVPPDYGPLGRAFVALLALAAVAALAWWGGRRWAGRFAKVEVDPDPFHRIAPDAWAFAALRALLDRRLAEEGREDLFHEELARIVRRYLSGRYRVDLMERTTLEIGPALRQAGVEPEAAAETLALLEGTDLAKFARVVSGAEGCRQAVEAAYRIVDRTRNRPAEPHPGEAA